jgi:uncharacterized protein (TIGR03435 family)
MAQFARLLSSLAGRDVIDRTELTGTFDIELTWTREDSLVSPSAASAAANDAPVLFTALREQLNLRLESSRGPVSVLVIDEVTPPTPD